MKRLFLISTLGLLSLAACKERAKEEIPVEPYDLATAPKAEAITILDSGYVKGMVNGVRADGPVWLWDSKDPATRKEVKSVQINQLVYITQDEGDHYRVVLGPNDLTGGYIQKEWIELIK